MTSGDQIEGPQKHPWRLQAAETLILLAVFAGMNCSPPPNVGESHYLAKAKHYWDPSWCAGDIFLESADVHLAFYWTFGWLTRIVPLEAAAWVGRIVIWLLLAYTWTRLSWAVAPGAFVSVLPGTIFAILQAHANLAGEWVIGGVEAKGLAYVLVLLALEAIALGRWPLGILWAGAATAFHVLVGGWLALIIGGIWIVRGEFMKAPMYFIAAAVVGLVIALPGLLPALLLNHGIDTATTEEANRIYVFERLRHHLDFDSFSGWNLVRFGLQLAAWRMMIRCGADGPRRSAVQAVVSGALAVAFIGVAIQEAIAWRCDVDGVSMTEYQRHCSGLLKFYWFRMSDALLPVGVALASAQLFNARSHNRSFSVATMIGAAAVMCAVVGPVIWQWSRVAIPGAVVQPLPKSSMVPQLVASSPNGAPTVGAVPIQRWHQEWCAACQWIRENTPQDALILTPRRQQTFKWYASRAEVANWKDIPQDAKSIVSWHRMMEDIFPVEDRGRHGDLDMREDYDLRALAKRYGPSYIVVERAFQAKERRMKRCYPAAINDADAPLFEVYKVD